MAGSQHDPAALTAVLQQVWGHGTFRPGQLDVIQAMLHGRDTFVLMSTGSGKSLCYQLPAVYSRKVARREGRAGAVTLVVSPLVSLVHDQVTALSTKGVSACALKAGHSDALERDILAGVYDLVYLTPEKLATWKHGVMRLHAGCGILMFAVDEAHCVSEWGHEFRADYLRLGVVREWLPTVPLMCLTATATSRVQTEVVTKLGLREPLVMMTTFNRPNLHYSAKKRGTGMEAAARVLRDALTGVTGSAIVYAMTRKESEEVADVVNNRLGIKATFYHGGMSDSARTAAQQAFQTDQVQVMVATLSFGMGVDKPDVRVVIHWSITQTLEAYYQQTGRAGRDGLASRCILLYSGGDGARLRFIMNKDTPPPATDEERRRQADVSQRKEALLQKMETFATSGRCRRAQLLDYFGEKLRGPCEGCDNCEAAKLEAPSTDEIQAYADTIRVALSAVKDTGFRYGLSVYASFLIGSRSKTLLDKIRNAESKQYFGAGKGKPADFWKEVLQCTKDLGFLASEQISFGDSSRSVTVFELSASGIAFAADDGGALPPDFRPPPALAAAVLAQRRQEEARAKVAASALNYASGLAAPAAGQQEVLEDPDEKAVRDALHDLRKRLSQARQVLPYHIMGAPEILALARARPVDAAHLALIPGLSEYQREQYGRDIAQAIAAVAAERGLATNVKLEVTEAAWSAATARELLVSQGGEGATAAAAAAVFALEAELPRAEAEVYGRLAQGESVPEIAAALDIPISRVKERLAKAMAKGAPVAWNLPLLGLSGALLDELAAAISAVGCDPLDPQTRLKPIFERLPPGTSPDVYSDLRLLLAKLRQDAANPPLPSVTRAETAAAPVRTSAAAAAAAAAAAGAATLPPAAQRTASSAAAAAAVPPLNKASKANTQNGKPAAAAAGGSSVGRSSSGGMRPITQFMKSVPNEGAGAGDSNGGWLSTRTQSGGSSSGGGGGGGGGSASGAGRKRQLPTTFGSAMQPGKQARKSGSAAPAAALFLPSYAKDTFPTPPSQQPAPAGAPVATGTPDDLKAALIGHLGGRAQAGASIGDIMGHCESAQFAGRGAVEGALQELQEEFSVYYKANLYFPL